MDFYSLCDQTRTEVGMSGNDATVVGATGEWKRLCSWVNNEYLKLQLLHLEWEWLRNTASFTTVADQATYPYADAPLSLTRFSRWKNGSFRIYNTDVGNEFILEQLPYDNFRDIYLIADTTTNSGYPHAISVNPAHSLVLALRPESTDYTVTGEYYKSPQTLALDEDVPELPEMYHMILVYKTAMHFAIYENAPELLQGATAAYKEMLFSLRANQLPMITTDRGFL